MRRAVYAADLSSVNAGRECRIGAIHMDLCTIREMPVQSYTGG
jgi:hypothetical protein